MRRRRGRRREGEFLTEGREKKSSVEGVKPKWVKRVMPDLINRSGHRMRIPQRLKRD